MVSGVSFFINDFNNNQTKNRSSLIGGLAYGSPKSPITESDNSMPWNNDGSADIAE